MNIKAKALMAFLTFFFTGFASGFIFSNAISTSVNKYSEHTEEPAEQVEHRERWRGLSRERSDSQPERMRNRLAGLLELTREQQEPFHKEMMEYRSNIRSVIMEARTHENELVVQHYEALKKDLSDILNREQLEKLDTHLHPDSVMIIRRMRGINE